MSSKFLPMIATSAVLLVAASAHADSSRKVTGPYAGIALGASTLRADSTSPDIDDDGTGSTFRVYGGYQFTDRFGAELGYARIGDVEQTFTDDAGSTTHALRARSLYAAATGRLPLTSAFSVSGKLGVSYGEVSGTDLPAASHATGHRLSPLVGLGVEYQPWDRVALSISYDYYGKVSDEVSANSLSAGVRVSF